jgi:hypothetical protein
LRAAAKAGLTDALISGQPVAVSYADDGMLLELVGQQVRLTGVLQQHVETLMDDDDVLDILNLIA